MKQISSLPLLLTALALTAALVAGPAGPMAADEAHEGHQVKLKVMAGDELVTVDLSDLELGQSKQISTDSGKLITATRDDQGYELDIDGKTIRIGGHGHGGVQVHSDDDHQVVIHERQVHREIREIRLDDGDVIKIEGSLDLEVGETRELTTQNSAPATLSRDDEGLLLSVGGEEIRLPNHHAIAMAAFSGEGEHVMEWHTDGGSTTHGFRQVIVNCDDGDEDCAERIKIKHFDIDNLSELDLENIDLENFDFEGFEDLDIDLDGDVKVFVVRGDDVLHTGDGEHGTRVMILRTDGEELHLSGDGDSEHKVIVIELDEEIEIHTDDENEPR